MGWSFKAGWLTQFVEARTFPLMVESLKKVERIISSPMTAKKIISLGFTRRDVQLVATGKASMSDMTEDDLNTMLAALKTRGFEGAF